MSDNNSEEAWLFLNHLSSMMSIRVLDEIENIGESKNISYHDLTRTLTKIKANINDPKNSKEWKIVPIKKAVINLCKKLKFDPKDYKFI